ncbi:MAG: Clp protease ClpP [Roseibium sp.]
MTLYITLGGRKAILQAMPQLWTRLEQDPCIDLGEFRKEYEQSSDMCEFLVFLSGGAPFYDGKSVYELLSPLLTCTNVYDRFVDHLVVILSSESTTQKYESDLREAMSRLRPQILNPKPVAPIPICSVESDPMQI